MKKEHIEARRAGRARSRLLGYRILKTIIVILLWVTCGMFVSMAGTTLVDFKQLLRTDFDTLGTVMVCRTVGYVIGCILASVIHDKGGIQSELILAVSSSLCALTSFFKPWSPSVPVFGALNMVEGLSQSSMNTVGNAYLLRLWGKKASVPLHIFHFGFGLGALLGPLLTKDFLSVRCPSQELIANSTMGLEYMAEDGSPVLHVGDWNCQNSTDTDDVVLRESRLGVPFSIVGALLAAISTALFACYLLEKCSGEFRLAYMEPEKIVEKPEIKARKKSRLWFLHTFTCKFVVGLFFVYMCISSFETVVYNYLFTFAYEGEIGFSKSEASFLSSAYWGSYTLGRLIASVVSHCVPVQIMVFVEMIGSLGSLFSLLFVGFKSKTGMWASACLLGVFSAPVWPPGLAWADRYITVRASVVAVTDVGAGIGGSICMWVAGKLVETAQTHSYLMVATSGCAAGLALIIVLQVVGSRRGDRHRRRFSVDVVEAQPFRMSD